jgi:hypothetical protein
MLAVHVGLDVYLNGATFSLAVRSSPGSGSLERVGVHQSTSFVLCTVA